MGEMERYSKTRLIFRSAIWAFVGLLLCTGLLSVGAALIYNGVLQETEMQAICWLSVAIAGLFTAFFGAGSDNRRIVGSFFACIMYFFLAVLMGEVLGGKVSLTYIGVIVGILLLDCFVGAMISGLVRR